MSDPVLGAFTYILFRLMWYKIKPYLSYYTNKSNLSFHPDCDQCIHHTLSSPILEKKTPSRCLLHQNVSPVFFCCAEKRWRSLNLTAYVSSLLWRGWCRTEEAQLSGRRVEGLPTVDRAAQMGGRLVTAQHWSHHTTGDSLPSYNLPRSKVRVQHHGSVPS